MDNGLESIYQWKRTTRNAQTQIIPLGFKAKVALDALHGELSSQQIAGKYKISTGRASTFKQQAIANITEGFERAGPAAKKKDKDTAPDVKSLHAKIGRLTMERDFLADGLQQIGISAKP